jgi:hypothetical protein
MNSAGSGAFVGALLSSLYAGPGCGGIASGPTPGGPTSGAPTSGGNDSGVSSDGATTQPCAPGQQVACACPGTTVTGAQSCNPDGHGYGPCIGCPSTDASGGSPDGSGDGALGQDGAADTGASSPSPAFDGTSGKPCATSGDCKVAGGAGINVCSNSLAFSTGGSVVNALPTPVCMVAPGNGGGNCDPAPPSDPSARLPHFCDGPDSTASPGICVVGSPASPHAGSCLPMCVFFLNGTLPSGCAGHDACVPSAFVAINSRNEHLGWGFCQGTCQTDSDCSALGSGFKCQTDTGYCTANPVVRAKQLGQACTSNDTTTGACNCFAGATGSGYCTSACVFGGAPCPKGWTCDTLQSAMVTIGGNAVGVPAENVGMAGLCVAPCTVPEGGPAQCPPFSTCQAGTPLGQNCLP